MPLVLTKTADDPEVSDGDQIGYTITIYNPNGLETVTGLMINDALPTVPGGTWSVAAGSDPSCAVTGSQLTCGPMTLAPLQTLLIVHVVSPTTIDSCGTYSNVSTYTSSNLGSGSSGAAVVTVDCAQIGLSKLPDVASVSAGDQIGFTITASNTGAGVAHEVTVTDPLPGPGWSIASVSANWTCTITSGTLTCGGATTSLNPGDTLTVDLIRLTTANDCGTITNTASVTTDNAGNATAAGQVAVHCAAISLTKTADNTPVSAGHQIGFTITAVNNGSGIARDVTMTDPLPATTGTSWTIASASPGWTCLLGGRTLTCGGTGTDLAPGGVLLVQVISTTTAASCGDVPNTAKVTTSNDGSAETSDTITVQCAGLSITKSADASVVDAGDTIGYVVRVTNAGPGTADGVTINDAMPAVPGGTWSVAAGSDPSCTMTGSQLSCGPVTLAPGQSLVAHLTLATTLLSCGTYSNVASFSSTNGSPPAGSSQLATVTVDCAQIGLAKLPDVASVSAGDPIGFTITASNTGDGPADDVLVTDPLPGTGWSIASVSAGWTCAITSGTLTCGGAGTTLDPGDTLTVDLVSPTTADDCGTITDTAGVTTDNAGTATASGQVAVHCATISLTKTADDTPVSAGHRIGFTITAVNNGSGIARDVTMTDPLPGTSWTVASASPGWTCAISGKTLTCGGPGTSLDPNGTLEVHVTSMTTAASCGDVPDTARVTTSNDGDADASATITEQCTGVSITKHADKAHAVAGDVVRYTVTIRDTGNMAVSGPVHVIDHLAGALDDASFNNDAKASSGSVAFTPPDLVWTGTLDPGQTVTIRYSMTVHKPDNGDHSLVNSVSSTVPGSTCPPGSRAPQCMAVVRIAIPARPRAHVRPTVPVTG